MLPRGCHTYGSGDQRPVVDAALLRSSGDDVQSLTVNSVQDEIADCKDRYVLGRNIHATTTEQLYDGTNMNAVFLLTGGSDPAVPPEIGLAVHVDDVASLHVLALDRSQINKTEQVQNFFLSKGEPDPSKLCLQDKTKPLTNTDITWNDVPKIAAEKFPEAVASGRLPASLLGPRSQSLAFQMLERQRRFLVAS
jgi:hypothetical protein